MSIISTFHLPFNLKEVITMTARVFIANAFSLQMVDVTTSHQIETWPMTIGAVRELDRDHVQITSAIGHPDTARVVSDMLGFEVPAQRINISLRPGDLLVVAQLIGGRLPEGATSLPEGFELRFVGVQVKS